MFWIHFLIWHYALNHGEYALNCNVSLTFGYDTQILKCARCASCVDHTNSNIDVFAYADGDTKDI